MDTIFNVFILFPFCIHILPQYIVVVNIFLYKIFDFASFYKKLHKNIVFSLVCSVGCV